MSSTEETVRYRSFLELLDQAILALRRVTIIGLGRMGFPVLEYLVRVGVATEAGGVIRLHDGDVVKRHNWDATYRQIHLGMAKCEACASHLKEINEDAIIRYEHRYLTIDDIETVADGAMQTDLLCLFADDFELMLKIGTRCHDICPVVTAVFGPRCDFAEVAFSIPGLTPSLAQTLGSRKRKRIDGAQALPTNTGFVAALVADVCLGLLLGGARGTDLMPCYGDAPLLLVGLRREWIFAKQPRDLQRSVYCVGLASDERSGGLKNG